MVNSINYLREVAGKPIYQGDMSTLIAFEEDEDTTRQITPTKLDGEPNFSSVFTALGDDDVVETKTITETLKPSVEPSKSQIEEVISEDTSSYVSLSQKAKDLKKFFGVTLLHNTASVWGYPMHYIDQGQGKHDYNTIISKYCHDLMDWYYVESIEKGKPIKLYNESKYTSSVTDEQYKTFIKQGYFNIARVETAITSKSYAQLYNLFLNIKDVNINSNYEYYLNTYLDNLIDTPHLMQDFKYIDPILSKLQLNGVERTWRLPLGLGNGYLEKSYQTVIMQLDILKDKIKKIHKVMISAVKGWTEPLKVKFRDSLLAYLMMVTLPVHSGPRSKSQFRNLTYLFSEVIDEHVIKTEHVNLHGQSLLIPLMISSVQAMPKRLILPDNFDVPLTAKKHLEGVDSMIKLGEINFPKLNPNDIGLMYNDLTAINVVKQQLKRLEKLDSDEAKQTLILVLHQEYSKYLEGFDDLNTSKVRYVNSGMYTIATFDKYYDKVMAI